MVTRRSGLVWKRGEVCAEGGGVVEAVKARMGFAADARQGEILTSEGEDLLVCCSRQWGKSTTGAALVAWAAMRNPGRLVLVVSPTLRQTGEFLRKVWGFLRAAGALGAKAKVGGGSERTIELRNGARVLGVPKGQAAVRGFSAPLLIVIDEAAQVPDETYEALRPMLATGGGRMVALSTPYGQRGWFWKEWSGRGVDWKRVEVRATECERIPKEFLEREGKAMGAAKFAQEYLCEFTGRRDAAVSVRALDAATRRKDWWGKTLDFTFNLERAARVDWELEEEEECVEEEMEDDRDEDLDDGPNDGPQDGPQEDEDSRLYEGEMYPEDGGRVLEFG